MFLEIQRLSNGGEGVAHLPDGRVVFVPSALPGDTVKAEIVSGKKDYVRSRLTEIVKPSADRVVSVCPHSDSCGGCPLICLSYNAQLAFKQNSLETAIKAVESTAEVLPPVSGPATRYRSRMKFRYSVVNGQPVLSLSEHDSDADAPIRSCKVADAALNAFIANPPHLNIWELKDRRLSCISTDTGVLYDRFRTGNISVSACGHTHVFPVSSNVFFQSNLILLPSLIEEVVSYVRSAPGTGAGTGPVMDLYSGVGTFSAFLEDSYEVTAVEIDRNCLVLARAHLKKTKFLTLPVEKYRHAGIHADTVIVDPPRTGLEKTVPELISSFSPSRLIYVSCYLSTLVRDLKRFRQLGWQIEKARLFDFYPNTPHLECVVLMSRIG